MSSGHFFGPLIHPPESDEVKSGYSLAKAIVWQLTFRVIGSHSSILMNRLTPIRKLLRIPILFTGPTCRNCLEKMCQSALRLLGYRRERDWMARRDTIRYFLLEPGLTDEQRRWLARMFDKLGSSPPKSSEESERGAR